MRRSQNVVVISVSVQNVTFMLFQTTRRREVQLSLLGLTLI
jgi:hypothetical protein